MTQNQLDTNRYPKIMNSAKDSYVAINLMTTKEKGKKLGYNISLIGWYGNNLDFSRTFTKDSKNYPCDRYADQNLAKFSRDNRDIYPIFDQHQLVYEPSDGTWSESYIKRIRSPWTMDYGLMKHILQFHKIESYIIPGKGYWDSSTFQQNVLNYHVPYDLSVSKIIERIENYYFNQENYLRDKTMQELVDIIYDISIESKFYRKMALNELDKRMERVDGVDGVDGVDRVVTMQVCQVIIKSNKNYEFLKELANKILKENEEAINMHFLSK
jgi:hypothetical protein